VGVASTRGMWNSAASICFLVREGVLHSEFKSTPAPPQLLVRMGANRRTQPTAAPQDDTQYLTAYELLKGTICMSSTTYQFMITTNFQQNQLEIQLICFFIDSAAICKQIEYLYYPIQM